MSGDLGGAAGLGDRALLLLLWLPDGRKTAVMFDGGTFFLMINGICAKPLILTAGFMIIWQ